MNLQGLIRRYFPVTLFTMPNENRRAFGYNRVYNLKKYSGKEVTKALFGKVGFINLRSGIDRPLFPTLQIIAKAFKDNVTENQANQGLQRQNTKRVRRNGRNINKGNKKSGKAGCQG